MKITDDLRMSFEPMADESEVRAKRVKMVVVRYPHVCYGSYNPDNKPGEHTIQPGERARFETAMVDGNWHTSWHCIKCIDRIIKENQ